MLMSERTVLQGGDHGATFQHSNHLMQRQHIHKAKQSIHRKKCVREIQQLINIFYIGVQCDSSTSTSCQ